jgi:lipopolysaccharide/colanic/teichoic acid biosynthesis glycosyltransferase
MKRALDVLLVLLAVPLLAPVTLLLALLVLVVDGRPVFFVQGRLGRGRAPFRIWKLRTMENGSPTRLGAWLRARGLDELPQLGNVARGEMSLVGPRPLTAADAERLAAAHPGFERRFEAVPGLTGLAQVCLAVGPELTSDLDTYYARRRTLRMDLWILLRTAAMNVLGKRRGAVRLAPAGMLD